VPTTHPPFSVTNAEANAGAFSFTHSETIDWTNRLHPT
jgi:hypothetical protein